MEGKDFFKKDGYYRENEGWAGRKMKATESMGGVMGGK